ncbi:MAG: hypothetical protein ACREDT_15700 [Methylocella sp.]
MTQISNDQALHLLLDASVFLQDAFVKASSDAKRAKLRAALLPVSSELDQLLHLTAGNMSNPYRVLTARFRGARDDIQNVINNRDRLISAVTLATKVANALAPLVALL